MNPFEVYVTFLALKRHFSTPSYDYFKYHGKIRCSQETFKKSKDRLFFERLSRKKKPKEIVDFFVFNFAASDNPSSLWIGDIIKNGEGIYTESLRIRESLSYIFEQDLRTLTDSQHLFETVKIDGSKHPKILRSYLNKTIKFETLLILLTVLKLKEKYNEFLQDPIWNIISNKLEKYSPFLEIDQNRYSEIIRKYI
jgi:hypothetical protein